MCFFECGHSPPTALLLSVDVFLESKRALQKWRIPPRQQLPFQMFLPLVGASDVVWPPPTAQVRNTFADLVFAVERGATAVAANIAEVELGLVVVARARRPSGFDYWLGDSRSRLFQNAMRLEVSGILRGGHGEIERRVNKKVHRLLGYSSEVAGLVGVVEFGQPQVHMIRI